MKISATFHKSAGTPDDLPDDGLPHVAFVGRSNVGKSSLVNHLVGRKALAKVSATPGRTRTVNFFKTDKDFYLVDLPGYGYAAQDKQKRAAFLEMIDGYLRDTPEVAVVLLVIDARHGATDLDRRMAALLKAAEVPFLIVMNKIDKVGRNDQAALVRDLEAAYPGVPRFPHAIDKSAWTRPILGEVEKALRAARVKES